MHDDLTIDDIVEEMLRVVKMLRDPSPEVAEAARLSAQLMVVAGILKFMETLES